MRNFLENFTGKNVVERMVILLENYSCGRNDFMNRTIRIFLCWAMLMLSTVGTVFAGHLEDIVARGTIRIGTTVATFSASGRFAVPENTMKSSFIKSFLSELDILYQKMMFCAGLPSSVRSLSGQPPTIDALVLTQSTQRFSGWILAVQNV